MKIYDKEIYKKQESIRWIVIIIIVFLLGFFAGYIVNMESDEQKENNTINSTMQVQEENRVIEGKDNSSTVNNMQE